MLGLTLREILHRPGSALLTALGIAVAVALFVVSSTIGNASERETRRVMRDLGYNLRIIPAKTDMTRFWDVGYSEHTMPQSTIDKLAATRDLSYNHLIAFLHERIDFDGGRAILTGISGEKAPPGKKKPSMIFEVKAGTAYLGHALWKPRGLEKGDTVTVLGEKLTVAACLGETGSQDDIRLYTAIGDAQRLLQKPGLVNEIKAIDCLCLEPDKDPVGIIRAELARLAPEARVVQLKAMAEARARERSTAERRLAFTLPFALLVCAAWIAVLALVNVRQRIGEIGVFRALGFTSLAVGVLVLARAALLGLVGAALGFAVGDGIAQAWGPEIFKVTARHIRTDWTLLTRSLLVAPVFAALCSLVPAAIAATHDPARNLGSDT